MCKYHWYVTYRLAKRVLKLLFARDSLLLLGRQPSKPYIEQALPFI